MNVIVYVAAVKPSVTNLCMAYIRKSDLACCARMMHAIHMFPPPTSEKHFTVCRFHKLAEYPMTQSFFHKIKTFSAFKKHFWACYPCPLDFPDNSHSSSMLKGQWLPNVSFSFHLKWSRIYVQQLKYSCMLPRSLAHSQTSWISTNLHSRYPLGYCDFVLLSKSSFPAAFFF